MKFQLLRECFKKEMKRNKFYLKQIKYLNFIEFLAINVLTNKLL